MIKDITSLLKVSRKYAFVLHSALYCHMKSNSIVECYLHEKQTRNPMALTPLKQNNETPAVFTASTQMLNH